MMAAMTRSPIGFAAVALLALGTVACGGTKTVTRTVTAAGTSTPPAEISQFGYIRSLTRKGAVFELRFDPALLLEGRTAKAAEREDSADSPGDFYVVNDSRRELTYIVPPGAHVTVVATGPGGIHAKPITVAQLAQIVQGGGPKLFEPIATGFWATVHVDTVRALDQQYFP